MGFLSRQMQSILLPADAAPLNFGVIFMLFSLMTVQSMNQTIVLPYLPRMMKEFGAVETDVGYNAGMVAGSMYFGMTFAALVWGRLSDIRGKRAMLILSTTLNALATLVFGFSTNILSATLARLLLGLTNGIIVIGKAIVYVVCDNSNQSAGMAVVLSSDTVGMIIGPIIGGYLSLPAEQYPAIFSGNSIFGRFPFLLPNLAIFIALAMHTLWAWYSLRSLPTMGSVSRAYAPDSGLCWVQPTNVRVHCAKRLSGSRQAECQPLLHPGSNVPAYSNYSGKPSKHVRAGSKTSESASGQVPGDYVTKSIFMHSKPCDNSSYETWSVDSEKNFEAFLGRKLTHLPRLKYSGKCSCWTGLLLWFGNKKWRKILMYKLLLVSDVRWSCGLYALLTFSTLGFADVLPLWASTSSTYGGLGFSTAKIGLLLLIVAIPSLILPAIVPRIMALCSVRKIYAYSSLCTMFAICLLPNLAQLKGSVFLVVASALLVLIQYGVNILFIAVNIMINNSTPHSSLVGSVNGIAFSAMNLARSFAPVILGGIFSWSLNNERIVCPVGMGYPFNMYLAFYVIALLLLLGAVMSTHFPESIKAKKRDSDCEIEI